MTTPAERRELYLDAAEQTEEWARDQRAEYADAAAVARYDHHDDRPTKSDLDEMRYLDDLDERRGWSR